MPSRRSIMNRPPMKRALLAAFFLAAGMLLGQGFSSHSGWSFDDTLQTATDIVVADIVRGTGVDNVSQVSAKAEIRVVRVLQGSVASGAEMSVEWTYQPAPFESPAASARIPAVRALWFLRTRAGGALEPLRAGEPFGSFGGFFLELPSTPISYRQDAELQTKLALEIGAALEDLIARRAADLTPHARVPPRAGALPEWARTGMRFHSLTRTLEGLKRESTADVYRQFSVSNDVNLKLLGLLGRAASGDADALCDMEQDLARLTTAYSASMFMHHLMRVDLGKNLRAAHCLARMALAEVTLPGLDSMFAMGAGSIRSLEFVPYLIALLASPSASTRGGALVAFCQVRGLASPETAAHCPISVPMNDRQQEQRDIEFWSQWWDSHREEIGKTTNLPHVAPPARYAATPRLQQPVEVPLEMRFEGLLHMTEAQATHSHKLTTGEIVNEPPPAHDPVGATLSGSDSEAWHEIVDRTNVKLAENQKRSMDLMNAGRIQGAFPPQEQMQAVYQDRVAILKAALQELQSRLSPGGWQALLKFMERSMGGAAIQMVAPK
jgi:hypothetical protein